VRATQKGGFKLDHKEVLRRLAIGDTSFLDAADYDGPSGPDDFRLDQKTVAFARLGASVALCASTSGYQPHVDAALAAGASPADVVGVLVAVWATVGLTRVVLAAPALGLAVGYDPESALESQVSE